MNNPWLRGGGWIVACTLIVGCDVAPTSTAHDLARALVELHREVAAEYCGCWGDWRAAERRVLDCNTAEPEAHEAAVACVSVMMGEVDEGASLVACRIEAYEAFLHCTETLGCAGVLETSAPTDGDVGASFAVLVDGEGAFAARPGATQHTDDPDTLRVTSSSPCRQAFTDTAAACGAGVDAPERPFLAACGL